MRNLLTLTLIFSVISCSNDPQEIINRTINNLTSIDKGVKYDLNKLTIQGNDSDTLFIQNTVKALFKSLGRKDDLLDFKFIVEDTFMHPHFRVPMKNTTTYDGKLFKFESINPMQNQCRINNKSEIKVSRMQAYKTGGHLPMLLKLLKGNSFVNRSVKDTLLTGKKSIVINQADTTGILYELFIQKEEFVPTFLRIISNPTQPFIEEFSYENFEKVDLTIVLDETYPGANADVKQISKGDTILDWDLNYLTGERFNFSNEKGKMTILCLSMINCGPCQMATKDIKKMYLEYSKSDNFGFVVFYPIDAKEKLEKYVKAKNIDYPIAYNSMTIDNGYANIVNYFKVSFPCFLILDENNKVVWMESGYNSKLINRIEKASKKFSS